MQRRIPSSGLLPGRLVAAGAARHFSCFRLLTLPDPRHKCLLFAAAQRCWAWPAQEEGGGQQDAALGCALPQLPEAAKMSDALLRAYAAHWLGLVPEQAPAGAAPDAAALRPRSMMRQPVGSRLPLPQVTAELCCLQDVPEGSSIPVMHCLGDVRFMRPSEQ